MDTMPKCLINALLYSKRFRVFWIFWFAILLVSCFNGSLLGTYSGYGYGWNYSVKLARNQQFELTWRAGLVTGLTKGT